METRKVVINKCYGGFGLSNKAKEILHTTDEYELHRDDPELIQVVESLGEEANGPYAELTIISIPADVQWTVEEYDGLEWIAEVHRTWS